MSDLKYINIPNYINQSGKTDNIVLSYQIFGKVLHTAPIVLVNHALTGNSNVCGINGWWNTLIGENKCIDTTYYTILAFNVPGNGYEEDAKNHIENYQDYTARNIANLFLIGLENLGIDKLHTIIGGSVGGGVTWEMAALKLDLAKRIIPIATDWKSTDWVIANCFVQDAILNHSIKPLEDARMHAMTLYRTPESFQKKFNRKKEKIKEYKIENWLNYHGKVLNERFQLSAYKLMNQILKTIDITHNRSSFIDVASAIKSEINIITISSDLFFKAEENWNTYIDLKAVKQNVTIGEIKSSHGHDAFLIEYDQLSHLLKPIFNTEIDKNNKYSLVWNR